jgi:hypothetical protein
VSDFIRKQNAASSTKKRAELDHRARRFQLGGEKKAADVGHRCGDLHKGSNKTTLNSTIEHGATMRSFLSELESGIPGFEIDVGGFTDELKVGLVADPLLQSLFTTMLEGRWIKYPFLGYSIPSLVSHVLDKTVKVAVFPAPGRSVIHSQLAIACSLGHWPGAGCPGPNF